MLPDLVHEDVDSKSHLDRDAGVLWVISQLVDVFNRDGVDLVVHVDALGVLAVAFNNINQVVYIVVTVELYVCIVDFVFLENVLDHALVNLGQSDRAREMESTNFLGLD